MFLLGFNKEKTEIIKKRIIFRYCLLNISNKNNENKKD
jgi:hypothetical protein